LLAVAVSGDGAAMLLLLVVAVEGCVLLLGHQCCGAAMAFCAGQAELQFKTGN
jgi:hypothetical protein